MYVAITKENDLNPYYEACKYKDIYYLGYSKDFNIISNYALQFESKIDIYKITQNTLDKLIKRTGVSEIIEHYTSLRDKSFYLTTNEEDYLLEILYETNSDDFEVLLSAAESIERYMKIDFFRKLHGKLLNAYNFLVMADKDNLSLKDIKKFEINSIEEFDTMTDEDVQLLYIIEKVGLFEKDVMF